MRILLTGSTGFLGGHLKARLKREGHELLCLGRKDSAFPVWDWGIEVIINCAGQLDDLEQMTNDNITLVEGILEIARETRAKVIQIGSSSETGPIEGPRHEETFCRPSNLYEATKLAATNMCVGYSRQFDLDISVARPFTLYGPGDKSRKMLPTLWRTFCERSFHDPKPFHCYPGGHDWLHVDDFVSGIIDLLDAPPAITKGQIFHFGTGISTSNRQVVEMFSNAVGGGFDVIYHEEKLRAYDVLDWRADASKVRQLLGWQPQIPLGKGIHDLVMEQWFEEDKG